MPFRVGAGFGAGEALEAGGVAASAAAARAEEASVIDFMVAAIDFLLSVQDCVARSWLKEQYWKGSL